MFHAALEISLRWTRSQTLRDCSEGCARPRGENHDRRGAADDGRAHENEIGRIGTRRTRRCFAFGVLFNRQGLAGQRCLLNVQVARLKNPTIGGNQVPRSQTNDIARNHDTSGDFLPCAVAKSRGRRGYVRT